MDTIKLIFDGKHFKPKLVEDRDMLNKLRVSCRFDVAHYESVLEVVSAAGFVLQTEDSIRWCKEHNQVEFK